MLVDAGAAQALHAEEDTFEARGFVGKRSANKTAAEIVGDRGGLGAELASQRLDGPFWHPALGRSPLRSLGDAVFLAEDVVGDLVHADGMGLDVFLVVGALGQPHVDDRQLQCGIGVGEDGNPLVGVDGCPVVAVRADIDLLDPDLAEEIAETAGELADEAPRGGLRVATPEEHHVSVLNGVFDDIGGRIHDALRSLAPDMLGPPVPAFPAIGISDLQGEAAEIFEEHAGVSMRGVDGLALAMTVPLHEDGVRPVLLVDATDLRGDESGSFVPGDAHELALATILRVAFAVRVPVDPFHREGHAIGGVDPFFVGQGEGAGK